MNITKENQFVPNFVDCVSAKYYLNWFTVGKVIAKIKRVNFLLRQSALSSSATDFFLCAIS